MTFAHDVVGQAAEGLGAHDVGNAFVDQLQHFASKQPSFAHFVAVAQIVMHAAVDGFKMGGRAEAGLAHNIDHSACRRTT